MFRREVLADNRPKPLQRKSNSSHSVGKKETTYCKGVALVVSVKSSRTGDASCVQCDVGLQNMAGMANKSSASRNNKGCLKDLVNLHE